MTTHSNSHLTDSRVKADRIVDELRKAGFSPEEISVLIPGERPAADPLPADRAEESAQYGQSGAAGNILVSVHLAGGRAMGRAKEIFGRAGSASLAPSRSEDDSQESWAQQRTS